MVKAMCQISAVGTFSRDYGMRDQIRRAAVPAPPNIAERFSRHSSKEFIQYSLGAKGSAAEAQSQLYIARDHEYVSQEQSDEIYKQLETVAKQISQLITYL